MKSINVNLKIGSDVSDNLSEKQMQLLLQTLDKDSLSISQLLKITDYSFTSSKKGQSHLSLTVVPEQITKSILEKIEPEKPVQGKPEVNKDDPIKTWDKKKPVKAKAGMKEAQFKEKTGIFG